MNGVTKSEFAFTVKSWMLFFCHLGTSNVTGRIKHPPKEVALKDIKGEGDRNGDTLAQHVESFYAIKTNKISLEFWN